MEETVWSKYKTFINTLQPNQTFDRKFMFRRIYGINNGSELAKRVNTIDQYRRCSILCGVISHEGLALYKKISNIPESLSITEFTRIAYDDSWKKWFIPLEERCSSISK